MPDALFLYNTYSLHHLTFKVVQTSSEDPFDRPPGTYSDNCAYTANYFADTVAFYLSDRLLQGLTFFYMENDLAKDKSNLPSDRPNSS